MSVAFETFIHLIAGGIGGTIGAIVTCPLEVVKTRQQSSDSFYSSLPGKHESDKGAFTGRPGTSGPHHTAASAAHPDTSGSRFMIWRHIRHIIETESPRALFKGLGPNLVGVAPSRAIYFCTYSTVKDLCNTNFNSPDTPLVHMSAAASAGFVSCTLTNPIWFIKTRLQLDQSKYGSQNTFKYMIDLYREVGFFGLYKGITASYFGISETIIHFVIYEFIKSKLKERRERICKANDEEYRESGYHVLQFMLAGAISKTCASIMTYPHEVARTRLRQVGTKYHSFIQTLRLVYSEEGRQGLYRGLGTQLIRQIPNTAIMMVTYELIVYMFKSTQLASS